MKEILLDKDGYEEYLLEIEKIKEKIGENSSNISEYVSDDAYGDGWHDNFAYEQAIKKERQLFTELENKMRNLKNIKIIDSNKDNSKVTINKYIDILFDDGDEVQTFYLTGATTSKFENEIMSITINSPLGKAIYNKKINDSFTYNIDDDIINGIIKNIYDKK